ncbi:MAG TPA: hypothetical protein VFD01_07195 [Candidatus Dormibacteraeota bacterium]|nr:hypothetical protein [Candidatus Dormibacteraeota bacterium]
MDTLRVEDLWDQDVFGPAGERLGRIEAVGMTRDRVPRHVGLRSAAEGSRLRFYPLARVRRAEGRLVLSDAPP